MKLRDKVAIITGGNSGIGRVTAILFACQGAKVAIVARDEQRGRGTVETIARNEGQATFIQSDVRHPLGCQHAVEETVNTFGRLDILFNNAGVIYRGKTVMDTSEEEWDWTMDTNVKSAFLMSKYAVPVMIRAGGGVIINNASYYGLVGGRGVAAYCASKGALVLLTKAMALDHAADNIRVNCLCPGSVETPMLHREWDELGGEDVARPSYEAKHPLGRICTPEEVSKAALYLASDDSTFVTGSSLVIDGGLTAG